MFSAIVTAFDIEAYKLLQTDPTLPTLQVLETISQQIQQLGGNSTSSTVPPGPPQGRTSGQSVRINVLWFTSLVCALFSALLGIMVKQWLREYMAAVSLSSRDSVRLRQHRFEGLIAWHVPEIMAFLSILLEASLILFLAGLVDFLFLLQPLVAGIITSLVGAALLFYVVSTVAPAFSRRCPYKSPQSWAIIRVQRRLARCARRLRAMFRRQDLPELPTSRLARNPAFDSWGERDSGSMQHCQDELDLRAMTWIHTTYIDHANAQDSLIAVIPELSADNASTLVFSTIARRLHLSTAALISQVRSRSCDELLRDAGTNFDAETRTRTVNMLLKLLQCLPRDHDPSTIGPMDVLWSLWELAVGVSAAEEKLPTLIRSVLDGVASLVDRSEPFRLRRAALNLLHEGGLAWTYSYHSAGS